MVKKLLIKPGRGHESELWSDGFELVAGVDEVGRGALAGPVATAAVVLPKKINLTGVRDSKLLTRLQRQNLATKIKQSALMIGVGWASAAEIDQFGLTQALARAGARALASIGEIQAVLLDGNHNYLPTSYNVRTIIKADQCCLSVAAASIIAKAARDQYMIRAHRLHPQFGFDTNVGYGTKHHLKQLNQLVTPLHRRSFAPVGLASGYVD